ncbi:hypothetical protein RAH32_03035 [Paracoccus sp. WLY502]|uniref:hypothetical protein n=1 Tax=Paracoccus yibinensis TaxID=3068891 RepID=UPI00279670A8|nr:hypothetical protein [Paracoccus sp. WLY502]MDQ1899420.1 hypothetical protein [Paracoccus sp. WLY502]
MVVRLLHPGVSPHIFRGAHEVWFEGERYDVLNTHGVSLLAGDAPEPLPVPPSIEGGAIEIDGDDLVLVPPAITAGRPSPNLTLASLTRDSDDVRTELEDGRSPLRRMATTSPSGPRPMASTTTRLRQPA